MFGSGVGITGLAASDLHDVAPLIGALQANGGLTFTCALLASSPAVNAGDNSGAPTTDQRGRLRPQGAGVDIGAFEFELSAFGNDDSDGDGFSNLQEAAFGMNPLLPDSSSAPRPVREGGYLTITLSKQPSVVYEVQSAGTLMPDEPESFSPATTTVLINDDATLKVRDNFLFGTQPSRYMRIKVIVTP